MASTVHVENISVQTSEKEIRDFFSFCGKISNLSVTETAEKTKSAAVTFEKETAAKTALLLDNTQLGPAQVHVSAAKSLGDLAGTPSSAQDANKDHHEDVPQEEKPRSRIFAEYLAQGYTISDKAIEKAITLDQQHGISSKFTAALKTFDDKTKASERAVAVDQKLGVSEKAALGWRSMNSYFDKALGTPTGQKLRAFYEQGNKQVVDVHNEARHLANLKKGSSSEGKATPEKVEGSDRTQCSCSSNAGKCGCAPGTCACGSCAKNPEAEASHGKVGVEEAGLQQVEGSDRTKCNCGAATEKCPCPPGKCACAKCAKNPEAV